MTAYKIWHDTKHYIHKNTTCDMDVKWTTNYDDAKTVRSWGEAVRFFGDKLGFNLNARYDALHIN